MTDVRTRPRHGAVDPDLDHSPPTDGRSDGDSLGVVDVSTTSVDPPAPATGPPTEKGPDPTPRPPDRNDAGWSVAAAVGSALALLGVLLIGFGVYLFAFSAVQQTHTQTTLYKTFRNQLQLAVAPTEATSPGHAVAILDAPSIGLRRSVVVEGTSPAALTRGPGHRIDTPLPGQPGISVVYGRAVTFGAPLGRVGVVHFGDVITVTTAQGTSHYRVTAVGSATRRLQDTGADRLVLVTADSQTVPHHTVSVSATLIGAPFAAAGTRPQLPASQRALAVDDTALQPLMMWSLALVFVATLATILRQRWARWPTYLCVLPVVLAVLWNVYENAAQLLPNIY